MKGASRISFQAFKTGCAVLLLSSAVASVQAAGTSAWDNASAGIYSVGANGWDNGDNGGFGLGPWTLNGGGGGFFLASSTGNNAGDPASNGGNDINTTVGPLGEISSARAWGTFNDNLGGGITDAFRFITNNADNANGLALTYTLSFEMDNGSVAGPGSGQAVGVTLRNDLGNSVWEILFLGGNANYTINDASGSVNTGVDFSKAGVHVDFMLLGPTTYRATVLKFPTGSEAGITNVITGTLLSPAGGSDVSQLRMFNFQGDGGDENNFYLNQIVITVPEPSAVGLLGLGGIMFWLRNRWK